ncbi:putative olfactory receptor 2W6 [Bufo gargarizans]|uniref:putative olfactory receptor 2W6 n=1 Tax=Bufo gargarizans TaxID=30331 RepID=UPI001CF4779B|nr:putative olfactory receptor 2W6 [Bufo gargarizans]
MEDSNQTSTGGFVLLGLSNVPYLQVMCFIVFLMMYVLTLSGNVLLIIVVRTNSKLHTPMYFFLTNLSTIDICFSSTIVPKILINTLSKDRSISVVGCALQMYFHMAFGATECIILAVMAYDRFAAICRPLHYQTIINKKMCACLASMSWGVGFGNATIHTPLTFQLPFCKSHYVNHFFCEMPPFFTLSCKDTRTNEIVMYVAAMLIIIYAFFLTLISYIQIIFTIFKIRSSKGREKAFSTCVSHITVVSLYYGTIIFMYLKPRSAYSPEIGKTMSILYTAVTPMLNPIIYSMRNKDVKDTIKIILSKKSNH